MNIQNIIDKLVWSFYFDPANDRCKTKKQKSIIKIYIIGKTFCKIKTKKEFKSFFFFEGSINFFDLRVILNTLYLMRLEKMNYWAFEQHSIVKLLTFPAIL